MIMGIIVLELLYQFLDVKSVYYGLVNNNFSDRSAIVK
jgi:hypothetical protein